MRERPNFSKMSDFFSHFHNLEPRPTEDRFVFGTLLLVKPVHRSPDTAITAAQSNGSTTDYRPIEIPNAENPKSPEYKNGKKEENKKRRRRIEGGDEEVKGERVERRARDRPPLQWGERPLKWHKS